MENQCWAREGDQRSVKTLSQFFWVTTAEADLCRTSVPVPPSTVDFAGVDVDGVVAGAGVDGGGSAVLDDQVIAALGIDDDLVGGLEGAAVGSAGAAVGGVVANCRR